MSGMLDDPALWFRGASKPQAAQLGTQRARFRPGSAYARDLLIPAESEGLISARYKRDGVELLDLMIEGVGYCTGVPLREMIAFDGDTGED